jgi:di-N-acetylchitobiase
MSQVSVDVPWSPFDIDGRNYEWAALALAADLLFVMAYDTQVGERGVGYLAPSSTAGTLHQLQRYASR